MASKDGTLVKIGDFGLSKRMSMSEADRKPSSPEKPAKKAHRHHHQYWQDNNHRGAIVPRVLLGNGQRASSYCDTGMSDPLTQGVGTGKFLLRRIAYGWTLLTISHLVFTVSYASPEQVKSRSYGTKADIFSLGLILLELLCCFETEHERYHNFLQCRQHQRLPGPITKQYPSVAALILTCTRHNPIERPTAKELLRNVTTADMGYGSSTTSALVPYSPQRLQHNSMLGLARTQTGPRHSQFSPAMIKDVVIDKLQTEVEQQRNEIAEKDRIIEAMRLQLEGLKATQEIELEGANASQEEAMGVPEASSEEGMTIPSEDDWMDRCLDEPHQSALEQGQNEGQEAGRLVGFRDGRKLGQTKAIEFGLELGWMRGVLAVLSSSESSTAEVNGTTADKLRSEKVQRTILTLKRSLDEDFPSPDELFRNHDRKSQGNGDLVAISPQPNEGQDDSEGTNTGDSLDGSMGPIDIMKQMQLIRARFKLLAVQLGHPHFSFQQLMQENSIARPTRIGNANANNSGMSAISEETPDPKESNLNSHEW